MDTSAPPGQSPYRSRHCDSLDATKPEGGFFRLTPGRSIMKDWKLAGAMATLALTVVVGAALPGSAQKKGDKGERIESTVGFVDLGQVTEEIKKSPNWGVMTKQFDEERQKYQKEIADLTKIRYLTPTERTELDNLRAKKTVTEGEKANIKKLEEQSDAIDREAQSLAGVEKPTPDQSKRIDELAKLRQTAVTNLQTETEKRSELLRNTENQVLEGMQKNILNTVTEVSKTKGLTLVVDRQAVLYGGQDLTEDVLRKLGAAPKK